MSTIYLIESIRDYDTVYKIGYTKATNAKNRLIQLQTGNDGNLKIINEYRTNYKTKLETSLKNLYKHKNIKNEWFALDISDIADFEKTCERLEKGFDALRENPFFNIT